MRIVPSPGSASVRAAGLASALLAPVVLAACTGLTAGNPAKLSLTAPVAYDSAWARVKRSMTGEVFTLERQDSIAGVLTGTRYPSPNTKVGSSLACRLKVSVALQPQHDATAISSEGLWTVYAPSQDRARATAPCDEELRETISRIQSAANPPTP